MESHHVSTVVAYTSATTNNTIFNLRPSDLQIKIIIVVRTNTPVPSKVHYDWRDLLERGRYIYIYNTKILIYFNYICI